MAAGAPFPVAPSIKTPRQKAIRTICTRLSLVKELTVVLIRFMPVLTCISSSSANAPHTRNATCKADMTPLFAVAAIAGISPEKAVTARMNVIPAPISATIQAGFLRKIMPISTIKMGITANTRDIMSTPSLFSGQYLITGLGYHLAYLIRNLI